VFAASRGDSRVDPLQDRVSDLEVVPVLHDHVAVAANATLGRREHLGPAAGAGDAFDERAARMLVFAVDLPVGGQVTRASAKEPFLGFRLDLDPARVAELSARVFPRGIPRSADTRGLYVGQATDAIIDAVTRLLDFLARPDDAELLAPLVVDEILIRLLRTPIGPRVALVGEPRSGVHQIARAVSWIRAHFAQPVTVEEMAESVNMSTSSFHQRFKAVTSMSPLQYQKVLRLHEARRLMLFQDMDAGEACHRVGYLSPSQFSREYGRFFGNAPTKDIVRLRDQGFAVAAAGDSRSIRATASAAGS
jgi:AraC-like DNA-binding protein